MILKRKIKSFFILFLSNVRTILNLIYLKLLEDDIKINREISIGKNVIIKTTDNGKIIFGKNISIEDNVEIIAQRGNIVINDNTFIGKGTQIVSKKSISIGKDCLIASYCIIRDTNHGIKKDLLIREQQDVISAIEIGNDVWLGTHVFVGKGVELGNGVVVGANSVVTKKFDEYQVIAGIPAKVIKERE